jgi:hypothetical protein
MNHFDNQPGHQDIDKRLMRLFQGCWPALFSQYGLLSRRISSPIIDIQPYGEVLRLPKPAKELRMDNLLVLRLLDGSLHYLQVEVQAQNDALMNWRMHQYYNGLVSPLSGRRYGSDDSPLDIKPHQFSQLVLYVGQPKMNMPDRIKTPDLNFKYELVDVRTLDAQQLLRRKEPSAFILSLLALENPKPEQVTTILEKIKSLSLHQWQRNELLADLFFISGLRGCRVQIKEFIDKQHMGIILSKELKEVDFWYKDGKVEGKVEGELNARLAIGLKMYQRGDSLASIQDLLQFKPQEYQLLLQQILEYRQQQNKPNQ